VFCPQSIFVCFVHISEQTAIIYLYSFNLPVFITEAYGAYCAVQTGSLTATATVSSLKGLTAAMVVKVLRAGQYLIPGKGDIHSTAKSNSSICPVSFPSGKAVGG
jgi:hypothetical protein